MVLRVEVYQESPEVTKSTSVAKRPRDDKIDSFGELKFCKEAQR